MKKEFFRAFILLHILLVFYSLGGICSKLAAQYDFLSLPFILYYGIVLLILFAYAVLWQQILKKLPLVTAYANKAVTVIWGMLWGSIFFKESVNGWKIIGALIIIVGVYLVVSEKEEEEGSRKCSI